MPEGIPAHLQRELAAVEAEIRSAFHGVTREGGVSWTEAAAIDGTPELPDEQAARAMDTERGWEELVDDPAWIHEPGIGGLNFLDPIGFRYYLAPAMIRCCREGWGEFTAYAMRLLGEYAEEQASLVTPEQAAAVIRFLRCMRALDQARASVCVDEAWSNALTSWERWDRERRDARG